VFARMKILEEGCHYTRIFSPAVTPITDIKFSYGKLLDVFFLYVPAIVRSSVDFPVEIPTKRMLCKYC
jgi:hypothetical protein